MSASTTWNELDHARWTEIVDRLRPGVGAAPTFEAAAQLVTDALVEALPDTALARVYVVVPQLDLPPDVQAFVTTLAGAVGASTPVLALVGSSGAKPAWHGRVTSKGHRGIPLTSSAFVDAIPMLARLLRELGIDLAWLDDAPATTTRRLIGGFNGVFYVEDARTVRDAKGRLVIPAEDFVAEQDVKTVFGMGGFYPDGTMVVAIVFTRELLPKAAVERLTSLITMIKGETFKAIRARRIFTVA